MHCGQELDYIHEDLLPIFSAQIAGHDRGTEMKLKPNGVTVLGRCKLLGGLFPRVSTPRAKLKIVKIGRNPIVLRSASIQQSPLSERVEAVTDPL